MDKSRAHEALLQYQQADEEGVMVLASRQAIDEVSDELEAMKKVLQIILDAPHTMEDTATKIKDVYPEIFGWSWDDVLKDPAKFTKEVRL